MMRKWRAAGLAILVILGVSLGLTAWAGDEVTEDSSEKKSTSEIPKKEYDLTGLDTGKPDGETPGTKPQEKPEEKKVKEVVRYEAGTIAPEGACVVVHFPDVSRTLLSAEKSPLGRLMNEEMLGRVWRTTVLKSLREVPPAAKGTPGGDGFLDIINRLTELCRGEVLITAYPDRGAGKPSGILLFAEMEERERASFQDSLEDLKRWAGFGVDASTRVVTKGDFEYDRVIFQKREVASYGFVGNQLVLSVGEGLYEKVLAAAVSKGDHSLSRDREWVGTVRRLGRNADVYLKMDYGSLMDLAIGKDMKEGYRKSLRSMSKHIRQVSVALSFTTGVVRERMYVEVDPESEMLKMMPRSAPDTSLAKLIPLDACYYGIEKIEPGAATKAFEMMKKGMGEKERKLLESSLDRLKGKKPISFEEDVLGAMSGDMAVALVITGMGATTDFDLLIVAKPKDMEKTRNVLKLLGGGPGQGGFRTSLDVGPDFHHWVKPEKKKTEVALPKTAAVTLWQKKVLNLGEGPMGPIKAYAIANQYVILGTSSLVVKRACRQTDAARRSSCIEDKPDFQTVRRSVGTAPNEISAGYLDLRRIAELLYALGGATGVATDLPPADKVMSELTGMYWSTRREASGFTVEVASPVGMLPLTGAAGIGAFVGIMNAAAEAERVAHTQKLKTIWRGLETFATDFGRYPLKLSELYKVYVEDKRVFLRPDQQKGDDAVKLDETSAEIDTKTGYKYITGRSPTSASNTLIVYAAAPDSRGRHWCLYTSGQVGSVSAEGLAELLGKNKK